MAKPKHAKTGAQLAQEAEQHRPRLLSKIRRSIQNQMEAEDVLQDVFAEWAEATSLGKTIESLSGWLMTVATNKMRDGFRRKKTRTDYVARQSGEPASTTLGNDWLRNEFREEILVALSLLPDEQREVFVKTELEGKSFSELSKETGVGINTLLSRKHYAILALRIQLKEVYDELE